jgi:hypothetical protein
VAEADTDTDTGTDTDTDPATDTAAATVTAPTPATVKATAPPVPAPTRRALPRRQPAARSIAAPSRDVVDQTLARIEPAFRTCYAAARRTGPVRVSLTIDEAGIAHDLETDPGSAPALVDCVRTKSDRLHRGDAPADVGVARVSFTVVQ